MGLGALIKCITEMLLFYSLWMKVSCIIIFQLISVLPQVFHLYVHRKIKNRSKCGHFFESVYKYLMYNLQVYIENSNNSVGYVQYD